MSELYFNERRWMQLLGGDLQAVRFLGELYRRAGGAPDVTYTLEETTEEVTNVDNSVSMMALEQDRARRVAAQLLDAIDDDRQQLLSQIKRLETRITQLENASE